MKRVAKCGGSNSVLSRICLNLILEDYSRQGFVSPFPHCLDHLLDFLLENRNHKKWLSRLSSYHYIPFSTEQLKSQSPPRAAHSSVCPCKNSNKKKKIDLRKSLNGKKPVKEPKQPRQHQVDEETIKKPIPLPMAETSSLMTDLNLRRKEFCHS